MKRPYEKGEVRRVRLVPEEAVLGACLGMVAVGPWDNPVSCYEPAGGYSCLAVVPY